MCIALKKLPTIVIIKSKQVLMKL